MTEIGASEARAALADVERRRRAVAEQIGVPRWYWWSVGLGWIALGVITDLGRPWLTLAATLVFGAVHAAVAPRAIDGRRGSGNLRVRADVVGRHVAAYVIGGLILLAAVTVVLSLAFAADGARHPVTWASVVVAVVVVLGGPLALARVRRSAAVGA